MMVILSKLFWFWCMCGILNTAVLGYDMFDGTADKTLEDLDQESKEIFDFIGGKPGMLLAGFLLGPILTFNILFGMGDK